MASNAVRRSRAIRRVADSWRANCICAQARQKEAVKSVVARSRSDRAARIVALGRVTVASVRDREQLAKSIREHLDTNQKTLADLILCDYLTLLGDLRKERVHTAILAFLLDPRVVGGTARAILVEVLRRATGKQHDGYHRVAAILEWLETGGGQIRRVHREKALATGKPDIVVVLADGRRVLIVLAPNSRGIG